MLGGSLHADSHHSKWRQDDRGRAVVGDELPADMSLAEPRSQLELRTIVCRSGVLESLRERCPPRGPLGLRAYPPVAPGRRRGSILVSSA